MYDELVKQLRTHNGWALNKTLDAAADAIEELTRENESLAKSVNALDGFLSPQASPQINLP